MQIPALRELPYSWERGYYCTGKSVDFLLLDEGEQSCRKITYPSEPRIRYCQTPKLVSNVLVFMQFQTPALVGIRSNRAVSLLIRGKRSEVTGPQKRKQEGKDYFPEIPYLFQVSELGKMEGL